MKMETITKEEIEKFEEIRNSSDVYMDDSIEVVKLSNGVLNRYKCMIIYKHYYELMKKHKVTKKMSNEFIKIKRKDILQMADDCRTNENIDELHIPFTSKPTFLDLIADYEDIKLKSFNAYNNIEDKMLIDHRILSIKRELLILIKLLDNAEERIKLKAYPNKIQAMKLLTEKQDGQE